MTSQLTAVTPLRWSGRRTGAVSSRQQWNWTEWDCREFCSDSGLVTGWFRTEGWKANKREHFALWYLLNKIIIYLQDVG